jgi:hypothetical protein
MMTREEIQAFLSQLSGDEYGTLMELMTEPDLEDDLSYDPNRYAVPGDPAPENPIGAQNPQGGGKTLPGRNGALQRLMRATPKTQGRRAGGGALRDGSNQNQCGQDWQETGGV